MKIKDYPQIKDYSLYILTDGKTANNTLIFINGERKRYIQEISLSAGNANEHITKCNITFFPLKDEVAKEESKEDETFNWENVVEIRSNGLVSNTDIILNGKKLEHISGLTFNCKIEETPSINFTKVLFDPENKREPVLVPFNFNLLFTKLNEEEFLGQYYKVLNKLESDDKDSLFK